MAVNKLSPRAKPKDKICLRYVSSSHVLVSRLAMRLCWSSSYHNVEGNNAVETGKERQQVNLAPIYTYFLAVVTS